MRIKHVLAALLALLPLALSAQQDTRLRALDTPAEASGWEAVGRLDLGNGYCTGTLIASDLVLTAAHCVYDLDTGALHPASRMVFRAGYRLGRSAADRRIARFVAHPRFDPKAGISDTNIRHDVALLKLDAPILSSEIDPFRLHEDRIAPGPVSVVSYGRGRSQVQSRQRGCKLVDMHQALFVFDCDITQGSSGAPVFSHLNGRGRIVSVISAQTEMDGKGPVALGMDVAPMVGELKRLLRAAPTGPAPTANARRVQVGSGAAGVKTVRVPGAKSVRPPGG